MTRRSRKPVSYREGSESESGSASDGSDDEFVVVSSTASKGAKTGQKRAKTGGNSVKSARNRAKTAKNSAKRARTAGSDTAYVEIDPADGSPDDEDSLFRTLSVPGADIDAAALAWIRRFDAEPAAATAAAVNLVLRSCGCVSAVQPHDTADLESAPATAAEIALAFQAQKAHEYPYVSTNKAVRFFRGNVETFFATLVRFCGDRGLLYADSGLMGPLLTWLLTLSLSPVRPLRYVSTSVVLVVLAELCEVAAMVARELEKAQRQLQNALSGRPAKVAALQKVVDDYTSQKSALTAHLDDVTEAALIHRYRDIDPLVRQDCVAQLAKCMLSYPDMFFQSAYLRCFGLLLADAANAVRAEVARALLKLYKQFNKSNQTLGHGLRQFSDRFKTQLVLMSAKDADVAVRTALVGVLGEMFVSGYLTPDDSKQIVRNFLVHIESGSGFARVHEERLSHEYARFVSLVNAEKLDELVAQNEPAIESLSGDSFNVLGAVKLKSLADILLDAAPDSPPEPKQSCPTSVVFRHLYQFAAYSQTWETILRYFILDVSSLGEDEPDEGVVAVQKILDLQTDAHKGCLLSFLLGALSSILTKKKPDNDVDTPSVVLANLSESLIPLLDVSNRSDSSFQVFLMIWRLLLSRDDDLNIFTMLSKANQVDTYNTVTVRLLKQYPTFESDQSVQLYDGIFSVLLGSDSVPSHLLTTEVNNQIQDIAVALDKEAKSMLGGSLLDDADETGHKLFVENLALSASSLSKLNCIGNYLNLLDLLQENSPNADPLTDVFNFQVFPQLDIGALAKSWPQTDFIAKLAEPLGAILDYILIRNSSNLETLTKTENQIAYEMESTFGWVFEAVDHILAQINSVEKATGFWNDNLSASTSQKSTADTKAVLGLLHELTNLLSTKLIDLLVSLKVFYMKFKASNSFGGFHQFFTRPEVSKFVQREIPVDTQYQLLGVFLVKEAALARHKKIELDRKDDEDVNIPLVEEVIDQSRFDSDEENSENDEIDEDTKTLQKEKVRLEQEKQQQADIWQAEKDLCVFTLKLYSLINLGMVNNFLLQRVQLNSGKLEGNFLKIVDQNDKTKEPVEPKKPTKKKSPEPQQPEELEPEPLEDIIVDDLELSVSM